MPGKRILLVDDDDGIRDVAKLALELIGGHEVAAAASGADAVELAAAAPPDAILLDVMMPDLDGPATLALLRDLPSARDVPVIFLTAQVQPTERERLRALGVTGVIEKPFDPASLATEVDALIAGTG